MYFDSNGKEISIGKIIGKGGEGSVYKTNRNIHGKKQVAKIYSNKDLEGKPLPKQVITERKIESAAYVGASFLTIVKRGVSALKPPTGKRGLPVMKIKNFALSSLENSVMIWKSH